MTTLAFSDFWGCPLFCFADLTSTVDGRERDLFNLLIEHRPDIRAADHTLLLVRQPASFSELRAEVVQLSDGEIAEQDHHVIERAQSFIESAPPGTPLVVASFRTVLQYHIVQTLADCKVEYIDFRNILRAQTQAKSMAALKSWPANFLSLPEAISQVSTALQNRGGSVKQTQLRPALTRVDTRWIRVQGRNAPQDNPKIISYLVSEAVGKGIITATGDPGDPLLTLVSNTYAAPLQAKPSVNVVDASPSINAVATLAPRSSNDAVDKRLSDQYIDRLKANSLGPFQEVRLAIYDEIDSLISAHSGKIAVRDLISKSVDKVRGDIEEARAVDTQYLIRSLTRNLPWGAVRGFITLLMTRQAVLNTDDGVVPAMWTNLDKIVLKMEADWRVRLDADLITFLVDSGFKITTYTEEDLSGALFDNRRMVENVQECISFLIRSEICEMADDYSLQRKRDASV
ncbi:hypothetical protein [Nocardia sp. NBC_00511]|uniref:hypothetical protein n=1 Tax=Nocardia sp. NBC_00511 TaxID=2903591 RepID=UPI0030E29F69